MTITNIMLATETTTNQADIGRGVIHYALQGNGPVLCLMSTLAGSWLGQARLLKQQYTILTYDMRGFGRSTNSEAGFPSNEEQAEDFKLLLDYLKIEKVTIVGLSHGGAVAQHFAVRFAEYLQGLVIVSSFAKASGSTAILLNLLHGFLARGDLLTFWEVLRSFLYSEKNFAYMSQKEKALKRLMFNQYTCESLEHIYACSIKHDITALLPQIKTPTLVIGGKEDILFPPKITSELTSLIPDAKEILLETAHLPPIEDPEGFYITLKEFLVSL